MIIELGIVAAAAAVASFVAARTLRKRAEPEAPPPSLEEALNGAEEASAEDDPFADLCARVGDVVQHGDATRWSRAGIVVRNEGDILCAVLLSEEGNERQATVAMAPPDRNLYWLEERELDLPRKPPARIEVDGYLLDRSKMLSVELDHVGDDATRATILGEAGRFALYAGTVGDAAVVIVGDESRVWYGQRLLPGDYDCLGQGE